MSRYIVGITGASGSIYGVRLVEELLKKEHNVYLIVTDNGKKVLEYELEISFKRWIEDCNKKYGNLILCNIENIFSPIASGSFKTDAMAVVPCSMGTLSKLRNGIGDNLLLRAADVMIKEKRKLILIPRETPLNSIHLENMLALSNLNVTILPPMPSFYHRPKTLDEIVNITVGRILASLNIENDLYHQWKGKE